MTAILIYETLTGQIVATPQVADYSWSMGINDFEGSVTIRTTTQHVTDEQTTPWA